MVKLSLIVHEVFRVEGGTWTVELTKFQYELQVYPACPRTVAD